MEQRWSRAADTREDGAEVFVPGNPGRELRQPGAAWRDPNKMLLAESYNNIKILWR